MDSTENIFYLHLGRVTIVEKNISYIDAMTSYTVESCEPDGDMNGYVVKTVEPEPKMHWVTQQYFDLHYHPLTTDNADNLDMIYNIQCVDSGMGVKESKPLCDKHLDNCMEVKDRCITLNNHLANIVINALGDDLAKYKTSDDTFMVYIVLPDNKYGQLLQPSMSEWVHLVIKELDNEPDQGDMVDVEPDYIMELAMKRNSMRKV